LSDFDNPSQVESIQAYINEIRVAGVQVTIINYKAINCTSIYKSRDAALLDENWNEARLPVNEALQEFYEGA
jgi:hypothetical protein